MTPKEFIRQVFINKLGVLKDSNPYIAFAIMATGIEFLGKCLDSPAQNWNVSKKSRNNFELAINKLEAFKKYRPYLKSHRLWDSLRNGFAHSFVPKFPLTLSSKAESPHMILRENNKRLNLKCEDFYVDFKNACEEIIAMTFSDADDKMNKKFVSVERE